MQRVVLGSWWRRSVGSLLLLAVVAGVSGGIAWGITVGATRTRTAYDRFEVAVRGVDATMDGNGLAPSQLARIRRIPQVRGAALLAAMAVGVADRPDLYLPIGASIDGEIGKSVNHARIVTGRDVRRGADELVLSEAMAKRIGVEVGDEIRFESYAPAQGQMPDPGPPAGPSFRVRLVGISRMPVNVVTDLPLADLIALPRLVFERYGDRIGNYGRFLMLDLGPAGDRDAVNRVAQAIYAIPGLESAPLDGAMTGSTSSPIQSTLDFVASALLVLAVAIGLAGAAAASLVAVRALEMPASEARLLGVIGASRARRRTTLALVVVPSAIAAGVVSVAVGVVVGAFLPFGLAGRAEPDPGMHFEARLLIGALLTAVVVIVLGVVAGHRSVGKVSRPRVRPSWLALTSRRVSATPASTLGMDLAFGSSAHSGVRPSRTAVVGLSVAAVALVATFVFAASTTHLLDSPPAYGWTWDASVDGSVAEQVVDVPGVDAVSLVRIAQVQSGTVTGDARGLDMLSGAAPLRLLEGRAPTRHGDVVLGTHTLEFLGRRIVIGSPIRREGRSLRGHIVGRAVFAGIADIPTAADGVALTYSDLAALTDGSSDPGFDTGVVGFRPGVNRADVVRRIRAISDSHLDLAEASPPADLERLDEVSALPWVLATFLGTLGAVSAGYVAFTSVRRRRRDIAIARTIGMSRGGVRTALVMQTMVLGLVALLIGVPIGLAVGRLVWGWFAGNLGVGMDVVMPWGAVTLVMLAGLAILGVFSLVPGRAASRIRPAEALRSE